MPTSRVSPRTRITRSSPRCDGWPSWPGGTSSELVQGLGEGRLLVGRLVLVDDALAGGLVELAAGGGQQLGGLVLLAGVDGLAEAADGRAQSGLHRLVAQARGLVGEDALLLRLDVGHAKVPLRMSAWVYQSVHGRP